MDSNQIFFLIVALLLLALFIRRMLRMRSIEQFTAAGLSEKLGDRSLVLLDVRTDAERRTGSIKGSVHIPVQELGRRWQELEKYRGNTIICYCQSGSRSVTAALSLQKKGFSVGNLRGGIGDWNYHHRTHS